MITLKQLQEKMSEDFELEFDCECSDFKDNSEYYSDFYCMQHGLYSKNIKTFLHQQTTLAFEAGKAEVFSENGANDMCEYWYKKGKAEMLDTVLKEIDKKLNSIGRPVEGISQELYNNDTWVNIGILEALDTLKNKLLDNK